MKKLLSIFLAMLIISTLLVTTASAADPTAKIIISNVVATTGIDIRDKTFSVYQVFSATVNNNENPATISYTWDDDFKP